MSIRFETAETIRASPDQILDALLDLEGAHHWMPGLLRMERLSPGPLGIGSEWRETRKLFGKEATEQFQMIGLERPHSLEVVVDGSKGSSGSGQFRFCYRMEPIAGETVVRLSGEIGGMTGVLGWLGRLFIGTYRKACRKDLAALKRYLEQGTPTRSGVETS